MKIKESYITLSQLQFHAFHGVAAQETKVGNTFIINLKLKVDFTQAAKCDEVSQTVSYADVYTVVEHEMKKTSKLLENVVYRIVLALFEAFKQIESIDISLLKNNPPMGADIQTAGVSLHCTRN